MKDMGVSVKELEIKLDEKMHSRLMNEKEHSAEIDRKIQSLKVEQEGLKYTFEDQKSSYIRSMDLTKELDAKLEQSNYQIDRLRTKVAALEKGSDAEH